VKSKKVKVIDLTKIAEDEWLEKKRKREPISNSLDQLINYLILNIPYSKRGR